MFVYVIDLLAESVKLFQQQYCNTIAFIHSSFVNIIQMKRYQSDGHCYVVKIYKIQGLIKVNPTKSVFHDSLV